jgi:DNA replication protein DnaC
VRRLALAPAFESVSLGGALEWCRAGTPEYAKATERALRLSARNEQAANLIETAVWKRSWGSLLFLGPTGVGKSKVIVAIAHRILDAAMAGGLDEHFFHAAMRIRFVSGFELAKAWAKHKLGDGDPPLVAQAKRASLLLLDEIGYEDTRLDPHAVRDVLHARDDRNMPTLATSGKTRAELDERYGEATTRRMTEPGRAHVIDLHQAAQGRAGGNSK